MRLTDASIQRFALSSHTRISRAKPSQQMQPRPTTREPITTAAGYLLYGAVQLSFVVND